MPVISVPPPWFEKSLTEGVLARAGRDTRFIVRDHRFGLGLVLSTALVTVATFGFLADSGHAVWARAAVAGATLLGGLVLELLAVFLFMVTVAPARRRREREQYKLNGEWPGFPHWPRYWRS